jgi:hypothetical protein
LSTIVTERDWRSRALTNRAPTIRWPQVFGRLPASGTEWPVT